MKTLYTNMTIDKINDISNHRYKKFSKNFNKIKNIVEKEVKI